MKKVTFLLLISFISISLMAQYRFQVDGSILINNGRIDIVSAGTSSLIIGKNAGKSNTSNGISNTFIGVFAGFRNTDGQYNTFLGSNVGIFNTTGSRNTFIGQAVGYNNTTGRNNTFIGESVGFNNTTGRHNTFMGQLSGYNNTTGLDNTFVGHETGRSNNTGYVNTFIGKAAGWSNTTGRENTFIGHNAGWRNTTAEDNTFVGEEAGRENTTGANNTFVGQAAGINNVDGGQNTFLGENTGQDHFTGNNNTLVGWGANFTSGTPIENSFAIGSSTLVSKSNSGFIGNISTQEVRSYVNLSTASDKRMKRKIRTDVKGLDFILKLRPVSYQMDMNKLDKFLRKNNLAEARRAKGEAAAELREELSASQVTYQKALAEKAKIRYTGFLAQDVEKAVEKAGFEFSGLIKPTNDQDHYSLRYAEFVVPLVKGMQEQQTIIEQQETEIGQLIQQVEALQEATEKMQANLAQLLATEPLPTQNSTKDQARLGQNQPNPVKETTIIPYYIPAIVTTAELQISDVLGRKVQTISISERGNGQITWYRQSLPSGTYFYSLSLDDMVIASKKLLIHQ